MKWPVALFGGRVQAQGSSVQRPLAHFNQNRKAYPHRTGGKSNGVAPKGLSSAANILGLSNEETNQQQRYRLLAGGPGRHTTLRQNNAEPASQPAGQPGWVGG